MTRRDVATRIIWAARTRGKNLLERPENATFFKFKFKQIVEKVLRVTLTRSAFSFQLCEIK